MMAAPSGSLVYLSPFNPSNPTHINELSRQRILCGWGLSSIPSWCEQTRLGLKAIFWILPHTPTLFDLPAEEISSRLIDGAAPPPEQDPEFRPLGHIALDWVSEDRDEEVAFKKGGGGGNVCLATFYVLKSAQGRGIGGEAISHLSQIAASPPYSADYLTLETWTSFNTQNPLWWASIGREIDPGYLDKEEWYGRKGFEVFKVEKRYRYLNRQTGEEMLLDLACMRKELS
ncbi:hypothetical protein P7C70_g1656, partial [Phenoliferia sp. Uapishka_3]